MEQSDDETEPVTALEELPPASTRKPCNARIDELAKPKKRLVLSLWENYAGNFGPERKETIRQLLQELYAMTPEETKKYFEEINKVLNKIAAREKYKSRLLKKYREKLWRIERKRAYHTLSRLLKKGMVYAHKHPVPPLVSPRLRIMADLILEQLCDIRGIEVPARADIDKQAIFLINFADWLAIIIEHIYYELQITKNKELDKIEEQIRAEREAERMIQRSKSKKSSKTSGASKKTPVSD